MDSRQLQPARSGLSAHSVARNGCRTVGSGGLGADQRGQAPSRAGWRQGCPAAIAILGAARRGDCRCRTTRRLAARAHRADRPRAVGRSCGARRRSRGSAGDEGARVPARCRKWTSRRTRCKKHLSPDADNHEGQRSRSAAQRRAALLLAGRRRVVSRRDDRGCAVRRGPGRRCAGGTQVPRHARGSATRLPQLLGEPVDVPCAEATGSDPCATLGQLSHASAARDLGERRLSPRL